LGSLLHTPLALFIVQAIIIIAASRFLGLVARVVRQPMVIAEVVAGILLGPSVLGLFSPGAMGTLFPKESMPLLSMFSQVGLILFMFLIGLELDPKLLRGRGRSAVVISQAGILVPALLGAALGLYLYPRLASPSVPFTSFVLFTAVAMSITAFPVLARILSERALLRTKVGALAITSAASNDVTGWCLLAFVVSLVRATGPLQAIATTGLAVAFIAGMIVVVRPLVRRLAAGTGIREGLTQNRVALTLLLLLGSAWTADLIGVHALFGGFLFGAVIPKDGGFARALADKLEDLVVVFLLPLFFAYSGLRTQIGLLNSFESLVMCGLIVLVATAGKFGGTTLAAKLMGLSWREAGALGILMNTRGLMELIVLNIGLDLGVISPALFTMMVLMALVTTFMTTPILQVVYPLDALAIDVSPDESQSLPAAPPRGFRVLMCVSLDRSGPGMVTLARALAPGRERGDRLYALRLVPPADRASQYVSRETDVELADALSPLLDRARMLEAEVRTLGFVSQRPAHDICSVAEVKSADLILLAWHKPLFGSTVFGGTARAVMKNARAGVGVFVDRGLSQVRKVLVPFQGTAGDKAALELARRITKKSGVEVTILHVVRPDRGALPTAREEVDRVFGEGPEENRTSVRIKLVNHATPADAAVEEATKGYDLVIVDAGSEWGLEQRMFGLLTETIVKRCPASLLILRPGRAGMPAQPAAKRDPYPTRPVIEPTARG
jgi:Kef-type K+ transport system membrane component KefB/nucleotide-binding universal stress UspA family protein